jgi:hypothetical protein
MYSDEVSSRGKRLSARARDYSDMDFVILVNRT